MNKKPYTISAVLGRYFFILLGSILTAVGLEIFFKAHNLIGGGVIGTAVALSYLTEIPLSAMIIFLNSPFLLFGWRRQGKRIILPTVFAVASLLYWISVFTPVGIEGQDILQSTIFGGIALGVGSGLILRYGGYVDGIEYQRKYFQVRSTSNIVDKRFVLINLLILCGAGLVFDWDKAIYSLIAYFVACKAIDITMEIFDKTREAVIISKKGDEVARKITDRMGKSVVFIQQNQMQEQNGRILCSGISNREMAILRSIIYDIDKNASVFFKN